MSTVITYSDAITAMTRLIAEQPERKNVGCTYVHEVTGLDDDGYDMPIPTNKANCLIGAALIDVFGVPASAFYEDNTSKIDSYAVCGNLREAGFSLDPDAIRAFNVVQSWLDEEDGNNRRHGWIDALPILTEHIATRAALA